MSVERMVRNWVLGTVALAAAVAGWGYTLITDSSGVAVKWPAGAISMQVKLATSPALSDGTSQSASVVAAMQAWNAQLGTVQFSPQQLGPGAYAVGNSVNEIVMDSTIDGDAFDNNTLAVTLSYRSGTTRVESDIIFNTAWTWNSYRGNLQASEDIRRVAIHELGHILGLDHPDQAGQNVAAVMNSTASNTDGLQADDTAGGQYLYGSSGAISRPGNDNFASATTISGSSATVTGTNVLASKEAGEPNHAGNAGGDSVWWKWTAPASGTLNLSTSDSNFDTLLAVYTGSVVNSLTTVASNDDADGNTSTSALTCNVTGGTTYYFAVDGWGGDASSVSLSLNLTPAGNLMRVIMTGTIGYVGDSGLYLASKGVRRGDPFTIDALYDPALTSVPSAYAEMQILDYSTTATVSFDGLVHTLPGFRVMVVNNLVYNGYGLTTVDGHTIQGTTVATPDLYALDFSSILYSTNTSLVGNAASYVLNFAQAGSYEYLHFFRLSGTDKVSSYPSSQFEVSGSIESISVFPSTTSVAAPNFTSQPVQQSPVEGQPAQFSVSVAGQPAPALQWQRLPAGSNTWVNLSSGGNYAGVNSTTFTVSGTTATMSGDQFRCVAINSGGAVASNAATLTVAGTAPAFTSQPVDRTVPVGQVVQFSVTAAGNPVPTYQWQRLGSGTATWTNISDNSSYSGATTATLTVNSTIAFQGDQFRCVATNNGGAATSNSGRLILSSGIPGVIAVDSGGQHSVFIGANGELWGMGTNSFGELGLGGSVSSTTTPQLIATGVTSISAGNATSFYIKPDGTLWGTGFAGFGQFGNNTSPQAYRSPIQVASGVVQVAASADFTMHLKGDQTLWAAGRNNRGQFGNGSTGQLNTWEFVGANVIWVATGPEHTLFIKSDGSLWGMGNNEVGQLGDGTVLERRTPVPIATDVIKAFAGANVSYFIKSDNTLWGMGSNGSGQLGDNSTIDRHSPVFISDNVVFLSAPPNDSHTLFIKTDGSLWGMGNNGVGELGIGSTIVKSQIPVLVANDVVAVSTGGGFSTFAKSDGTYWGMGQNVYSQLGPLNANYFLPRLIASGPIAGPASPAGVAASDSIFLNGVSITWSPVTGGAYYEVWRNTSNNSAGATRIATNVVIPLYWDKTASSGTTYSYWVKAANSAGTSGFSSADTGMVGVPQAPAITAHPGNAASLAGGSVSFTLSATGVPPPTYKWQYLPMGSSTWSDLGSGGAYSGATSATLTVSGVLESMHGNQFRCVATNIAGSVTSNAATLAVLIPPNISVRPASQLASAGGTVNFNVTATGATSYAWKHNGVVVAGATSATLSIANATLADRGLYEVIASNADAGARCLMYLNVAGTNTVTAWGDNAFGQTSVPAGLANLAQISGGVYHTLALKSDGTVAAWGSNSNGQSAVPGGLSGVVAVSAGRLHSVALKSDGTVVAWGDNSAGQCTIPGGLNNVVWISAGGTHTTALKNDGTIVAWGDNTYGQCTVPAGLSSTVAGLSAGLSHTLALKNDGTVVAWGRNDFGQITIPSGLSNVVSIDVGASHNVAIKADGTVVAWGRNDAAQTAVPAGLTTVRQVDSLGNHTLALKADGSVVAWGNNANGQSAVPAGLGAMQQVAAGALHSVALVSPQPPAVTNVNLARNLVVPGQNIMLSVTATGSGPITYQWTRNGRNVVGATASSFNITGVTYQDSGYYSVLVTNANGTTRSKTMFVRVAPMVTKPVAWGYNGGLTPPTNLNDAVALASSSVQALAIKRNGTVVAWGTSSDVTSVPAGLTGVVDLRASADHVVALKDDGTVVAWGANYQGKATVPAGLTNVVAISTTSDHVLALKDDGTVVAWGDNTSGQCTVPAGLTGVVAIAAGGKHSLAMKQDGSVVAWGYNLFGQTTIPAGVTTVSAIAAGSTHSMVINTDGTVTAWGDNSSQQLNVPAGLSGVTALSSLSLHTLALKTDGTVRAWGYGGVGNELITVPAGLANIIAVAPGGNFSLVLRDASADVAPSISMPLASRMVGVGTSTSLSIIANGASSYVWKRNGVVIAGATASSLNVSSPTLADRGIYEVVASNASGSVHSLMYLSVVAPNRVTAWGDNALGQVAVPAGLVNLAQISAGVYHTLALKSDGTVVAWGNNANGQCNVPAGLGSVIVMSAGRFHSVAVKSDSTVVAWGDNSAGQCNVPAGLSGVVWVSAGGTHTVALKNDGTIVAWGDNTSGQCNVPAGLAATVAGISAGQAHTVALKNDGTVVAWGRNDFGQTTIPAGLSNVVMVDAGAAHNVAVKSDGTVVAWGRNDLGQTAVPAGLTNVRQVDSLGNHTLAVKADGTVVAWGTNGSGQTILPAGLNTVQQVAAGALHSVVLRDPAPQITGTSASRVVLVPGQGTTLSVTATTGAGTLSYQWLRNGRPISGATGSSLVISNASAADAGYYLVDVTDAYGPTRSHPFFVIVAPATTRLTFWGRNDYGQGNFPAGVNDIVALAPSGNAHNLAIRRNGTVLAWGVNDMGQTNIPAGLSDVVAVAGSNTYSLALKGDGTVVGWGSNPVAGIPAGLTDVVAIGAGNFHAIALRSDGTVVQWQDASALAQGAVPADLRNVVAIAAATSASLALKSDGTVVGWGGNVATHADIINLPGNVAAIQAAGAYSIAVKNDGTVKEGMYRYPSSPSPPANLSGVAAAAEGGGQGLALKADGTVVGWGDNFYGEATPPADLADVLSLCPGYGYSLVLRNAIASLPVIVTQPTPQAATAGQTATFSVTVAGGGLSYQWRRNGSNLANGSGISGVTSATLTLANVQAGAAGNYTVVVTNAGGSVTSNAAALTFAVAPTPAVTSLTPVRQVLTPGQNLTLSVTASGDGPLSYQWKHNGRNVSGATSATFPLTNLTYADNGWYQVVITNNLGSVRSKTIFVTVAPAHTAVVAWGYNFSGQSNVPAGLTDATTVAGGGSVSFALRANGSFAGWGESSWYLPLPTAAEGFVTMASGTAHNIALKPDGTVVAWGTGVVPAGLTDVVALAAGSQSSYALKSDGTVVAWDASSGNALTLPAGLQDVVGIAAHWVHAVAVKSDGTVVSLDGNGLAPPDGLTGVTAVATGRYFSAALKSDGTVVVWNLSDVAGYWPALPNSTDLSNVTSIAAGATHLLLLKSDGTVKAFGENAQGQTAVPAGLAHVIAVASGDRHSLALVNMDTDLAPTVSAPALSQLVAVGAGPTFSVTASGATSYIWKKNGTVIAGATGNTLTLTNVSLADRGRYEVTVGNSGGTTLDVFNLNVAGTNTVSAWGDNGAGQTTIPAGLANLAQISAGVYHTLALKANGTVVAWGDNAVGQCNVPAGLSNVVAVSAGRFHSVALKGDGTVVAWGLNDVGQSSVPAGLSNVVWVSAGGAHTAALKSDGTIVTWGDNTFGQCTVPAGLSSTAVGISAGLAHTLALKNDGTVVAWGRNDFSQTTIPGGLSNVVSIDAGASHNVAIKSDGTMVAWGRNDSGQTALPGGLTNVGQADSLGNHTLALKADGSVVAWGANGSGQATVPSNLGTVQQVAAGALHSVALVGVSAPVTPAITAQPANQTVTSGQLATFTVVASGGGLSYQWRRNGSNLTEGGRFSGTTQAILGIGSTQSGDAGNYDVVVSNSAGSVTSNIATLTVNAATGLPSFDSRQPSVSAVEGGALSTLFTVTGATSYVWKRNGVVIAGATTNGLNIASATLADRGLYEVTATNASGSVRSLYYVNIVGTNTVSAWGDNGAGQTTVPAGLSYVSQISAGVYHTLALKADGTVVAWGDNAVGQCSVPAGLSNVVAVSAGRFHSVALKGDGTVVAWGLNDVGQSSVPAGLNNVVWISAGGAHTVAMKNDGTIVTWGDNTFGQCTVPAGLSSTVVGISAGLAHTVALKNDGTVVAWGKNDLGQTTIPAGLSNVVSIDAGASHNVAIKSDGTVVAWGRNDSGQTALPGGLTNVRQVDSLGNHTLALKADGSVVAWGANGSGQVTLPAGFGAAQQVAAGALHSVALITIGSQPPPVITTQPADQVVVAGQNATFTIVATGPGISYQWRKGASNLTDGGNLSGTHTATLQIAAAQAGDAGIYSVELTNTSAVVASNSATLTVNPASGVPVITARPLSQSLPYNGNFALTLNVTGAGDLTYTWKHNGVMLGSGLNANSLNLSPTGLADRGLYEVTVTSASGSVRSLFYVNVAGTNVVRAWGDNGAGQTTIPAGLANLAQISAGVYHTLALKADGTVVAWGDNAVGQCSVPAGLSNVVAVSAGRFHSVALKGDGTVVAWGLNDVGQSSVPAGLNNVVWISAGGAHTVAMKNDGTIVTWGDNTFGQCTVPAGLSSTVVGISAGLAHTVALKNDGTVVAWGKNDLGQTTIPAGLSNVVSIDAGASHNVAIKSDGTVVAWGRNDSGQTALPGGLTNVRQADSLGNHTLALKADGSVVAWGANGSGQATVPSNLGTVQQVAAGALHSVALITVGSQPPPFIVTQPANQSAALGQTATFTVVATGQGITYQWRKGSSSGRVDLVDGGKISGSHTAALQIANVQSDDGDYYSVELTNASGVVASNSAQLYVTGPTPAPDITGRPASAILPAFGTTALSVTVSGSNNYAWKRNGLVIAGANSGTLNIMNATVADRGLYEVTVTNSSGSARSLVYLNVAGTNTVSAWGDNGAGQTTIPAGLANLAQISAGVYHTLALRNNGTVVAWGDNAVGQCSVPAGLSNVVAVSAGRFHSVALKGDGTVVAWGLNDVGQSSVPAGLNNVVWISAGGAHTVAMKNDGTIVTWGDNTFGQCTVPAGLSSTVVGISAGLAHTVALKNDGTVVAWGRNDFGQTTIPGGLSNVVSIDVGASHNVAVKSDGTVVAWGRSDAAQSTIPAGLTNVVQVDSLGNHSLALKANGSVVAWGANGNGQASVPSGLGTVQQIAAGALHSVVLTVGPSAMTVRAMTASNEIVSTDASQAGLDNTPSAKVDATLAGQDGIVITSSSLSFSEIGITVTGTKAQDVTFTAVAEGAAQAPLLEIGLERPAGLTGLRVQPAAGATTNLRTQLRPGRSDVLMANPTVGETRSQLHFHWGDPEGRSRMVRLSSFAVAADAGAIGRELDVEFVVEGTDPRRMLFRATGLAAGGAALLDPSLVLLDGAGRVVASNDNWWIEENAADLAEAASFAPSLSGDLAAKDAAIMLQLKPGRYTIRLTALRPGTGLLEFQEVP